jgi:hypothetical protein
MGVVLQQTKETKSTFVQFEEQHNKIDRQMWLELELCVAHGDLLNVRKSVNELDPNSRWHVYTEDKPASPTTTGWIKWEKEQ